ncbi:MAG: PilZ domain-containing protein [Thermodesulfobacteriota bacterium]|nr:PilZ domain-containing protein [Thermodesulfobacteriota bacterium]
MAQKNQKGHLQEKTGSHVLQELVEASLWDQPTGSEAVAADQDQVVRKCFRIPIGQENGMKVRIGDASFDVLNISENGIGVLGHSPEEFRVGEGLDGVTVFIEGAAARASGTVRHITPLEDGLFLFGVALHYDDPQEHEKVLSFVRKARREMFRSD